MTGLPNKIEMIGGGMAQSGPALLRFVNGFTFRGVKRFYLVETDEPSLVRAWHAHWEEAKYVFVVQGMALVGAAPIDNMETPSRQATATRFLMSGEKPQILYIPPRHANGFKSLTKELKIVFYSTSTLEESQKDDQRLPPDYFGSHFWEKESP